MFNHTIVLKPTFTSHEWTLLGAGEVTVGPEWIANNTFSPFTRLYLVTEGSGELCVDGQCITMQEGHMYIVPAFRRHSHSCKDSMKIFYLHVHDELKVNRPSFLDDWILPSEIKVLPTEALIFPELLRLNPGGIPSDEYPRRPVEMITDSLINVLIGRWLMDATPRTKPEHGGLAELIEKIKENPTQKFPTHEMAEYAKLSHGHFCRLFRQETGMTPQEFVRHNRMMVAQTRLATETTHIKDIAQELGYDDFNYFTRAFTKDVGMSPSQFRRESHEL